MIEKIKNLDITLGKILTYVAFLSMISTGIGYIYNKVATRHQLDVVQNDLMRQNVDTHISLLYLKYSDQNDITKWDLMDQEKYNGLIESRKALEKERRNLAGIPERIGATQ